MRSARDLEYRLKRERPAAAQKTNETSAPAPAQHRERVQDRRVAYDIQHRIDPFGIAFADPLAELRGFQQNAARAEPLQHRGARHIARRRDNPRARLRCNVYRGLAERRGRPAYRGIDNYPTPHTTQLHVVERFKVTNGGKTLEATIQVDDPGTFNMHGQRGRFSIARAPEDGRRPSARKTISPSKGTRPSLKPRRPSGRIFDAPPAATFTHFDRLGELAGWANGALFAPRPRRLPQRWACFPLPTLRDVN